MHSHISRWHRRPGLVAPRRKRDALATIERLDAESFRLIAEGDIIRSKLGGETHKASFNNAAVNVNRTFNSPRTSTSATVGKGVVVKEEAAIKDRVVVFQSCGV